MLLARGEFRYAPRYVVEVVDRIGAGDSFVGGLIHGLLDGDPDLGIRLGAFAAAIGLATPGDINYLGVEDIARFHADRIGGLEPSCSILSWRPARASAPPPRPDP